MATFDHISGAEPSTVSFKLATVTQTRNSSVMHQEILALGDPETSNAIAAVRNSPPASTVWALAVRIASGPSSLADFQVRAVLPSTASDNPVRPVFSSTHTDNPVRALWSSTRADNLATVYQSSAADLNVTVAGYVAPSTIVTVSTGSVRVHQSSAADLNVTVAGYVAPSTIVTVSTGSVRVHQSTASDLNVTAVQGGVWSVNVGTHLQSTVAPSSGSSGLVVRQVIDNILTTASTNAFASTSLVIQSSGAALRSYVTAYTITSTVQAPTKVAFYSSGTMTWPLVLAALSSAVAGVNLAVAAPAYLFRSAASEALTLQVPSSVAGFKVGVSYFRAP
jgi:hypothetical protein